MKRIAFDFETHQIAPGAIAPPAVCLSLAAPAHLDLRPYIPDAEGCVWREREGVVEVLTGNDKPGRLASVMAALLSDPDVHLYGANTAFDAVVAMLLDPEALVPLVFAAAADLRLHDVQLIEQLLRLSTVGQLETMTMPDGRQVEAKYSLADLEMLYLGRDRRAEKEHADGTTDYWRTSYSALDGWRAIDYPDDAIEYAIEDARGTLLVAAAQRDKIQPARHGSANTEAFQCAVAICLYLKTEHGLRVDEQQVGRLEAAVASVLSPENHKPLYDAGLLSPAEPPRPHARGAQDKSTTFGEQFLSGDLLKQMGLSSKAEVEDYFKWLPEGNADKTALRKMLSLWDQHPPKTTAGKPEKRNDKAIREYVKAICDARGIAPKLTESGQVSMDADTVEQLSGLDEKGLLKIFARRQELDKVKSSFLPPLKDAVAHGGRIYPRYNPLVSTGRSSGRGNPKGRQALYPSWNNQNIMRVSDGHLNVRACIVPDPGTIFCTIDFSALELCTFAQKTYELFGFSVHRDKINLGYDLHAYLGAQLAATLDADFREAVRLEGIAADTDAIYREFRRLPKSWTPELEKLFKHYRTFAKPTGLGYPGGLGAQKFIDYARMTYGVTVDLDTAQQLKSLWLKTYPEADKYLNEWVPMQEDPLHRGDENGGLCYESPLGMFRANATYCAVANGYALQTPAAEGAKLAVFETTRRCLDRSLGDPLFGGMPVFFVHDEIGFQFPEEEAFRMGERAAGVMCDAMRVICPDVTITAKPAYMRRWLKGAEPATAGGTPVVYDLDSEGRIVMFCNGKEISKHDLDS